MLPEPGLERLQIFGSRTHRRRITAEVDVVRVELGASTQAN
jgi:hypothetical protein